MPALSLSAFRSNLKPFLVALIVFTAKKGHGNGIWGTLAAAALGFEVWGFKFETVWFQASSPAGDLGFHWASLLKFAFAFRISFFFIEYARELCIFVLI